jgi:hypothetical protein
MGGDSELEKNQIYALPTLNLREIPENAFHIFDSLGATFSSDSRKLLELKKRINEGRFHLAISGQFKQKTAFTRKKDQSETIADEMIELESATIKLVDIKSKLVRDSIYAKQ